ncbi:MAG TPA: DUF3014 domain-containing protein [Spongiibacteraceae bacterium]|nr:DUF3014 domain-containing protein [Spongiibacteraceae bacterium]
MKKNLFGIVAIAVVVAFGIVVWQKLQPQSPESTQPQVAQNLPVPPPVQTGEVQRSEPVPDLPPPKIAAPAELDGSDLGVRSAIADLAPQLLPWLTPEEQIRKWVMLVDVIADGSIPSDRRPLAYAVKPFEGKQQGDVAVIDPADYERATPLVDAIVAIPPEHFVQYYRHWKPLLERAYRELGKRDSFDARLRAAISRICAAHQLPANAEIKQVGVYFIFTNPDYEKASDLDKLLWRMGPDNLGRLQAYLNKLRPLL